MATFKSLPLELRQQIYQYCWKIPLSRRKDIHVLSYMPEQIWSINHNYTPDTEDLEREGGAKVIKVKDGNLIGRYQFSPYSSILGKIYNVCLVERTCYLDLINYLYEDFTFHVSIGRVCNSRMHSEPGVFRLGCYHPIPPIDTTIPLNLSFYSRMTSMELIISDNFEDAEARRRVSESIERLVTNLRNAKHRLRRLIIVFHTIEWSLHRLLKNEQRYQYLLEDFALLRVDEVHIEGGASRDFASKLKAVMTGKYEGNLREIEYGVQRHSVGCQRKGRKRKALKEVEEGQIESRPYKRRYFQPVYDWGAVTISRGPKV
ncbi:hypothetical protein NA57DRAFT_59068 [Rhizodiscina lignyota]|uniref:Uncharacterized protein n=1 Tax=Rhizodiscina lignyota TaxID=1504668 RepID=A0A9P4M7P3_9PEZI|nr:hypothetical protein NA57DRAFT_59068 [Rhizodiscina lignyota]